MRERERERERDREVRGPESGGREELKYAYVPVYVHTQFTPTRHITETRGHYRYNQHSHTHQATPLKGPENPSVKGVSACQRL